jgi:hypothetical protein
MAKSLFHKKPVPDPSLTPYELIEPEIVHLKKGYSIRHGAKTRKKSPLWLVVLGFCGLAWLYLMDPIIHAWYKGEAAKTYVYLHNYGAGPLVDNLIKSGILTLDEIDVLNRRHGSFQGYYPSPQAADDEAQKIIDYMDSVHQLHNGLYQDLDPIGRMRYLLFIRTGLVLPTDWAFLDPNIKDE